MKGTKILKHSKKEPPKTSLANCKNCEKMGVGKKVVKRKGKYRVKKYNTEKIRKNVKDKLAIVMTSLSVIVPSCLAMIP